MKDSKGVRRALSMITAMALLWGSGMPGRAMATETVPEETQALMETEATDTVTEETTISATEVTAETTVPTTETTVPMTENTLPLTETTVPTAAAETTEAEEIPTLMSRMEAMAERAKTLAAEVAVLDAFTEELRVLWNEAYDQNEAGILSEEELAEIDGIGWEILAYLKTEYRYENGRISPLAAQRYGSQETPMSASEYSVASLGSGSGIKFRIFNYTNGLDANGNYITAGGINDNGLDGYFNFRGTSYENTGADGNKVSNFTNSTTDIDGYTANHATVLRNLGSDGYPVFDGSRDSGPQKSLGYLFGAGGKGVTGYTAANTPLRLNSKGQYYYNSADNAVDFDTSTGRFIVRTYRERGKDTADQGSGQYYDFFPFTYWDGSTKAGEGAHWYNYNNTVEVDYWYGMTMEAAFSMPEGGIVKVTDDSGNVTDQDQMVFEFSGDDDVWVFIDDVLVLDLGGTHGVVSGSINFATGEVKQYLDWGGATSESAGTSYPTTLKAQFEAAGKAPKGGWNGDVFSDYTEHTIKFYYLERATSCANCKILFNMPILPTGVLTVEKQVEGMQTEATEGQEYTFTLVQQTDGGERAAAGVGFDRIDAATGSVLDTGITASDGSFALKAGQRAEFALTAGKTFLVRETGPGDWAEPMACTVNGLAQAQPDTTGAITIDPNSPAAVVVTNRLKTTQLTVRKQVAGNLGDRDQNFSFRARLYSGDPGGTGSFLTFPEPGEGADYQVEAGEARFQLRHDGEVVLQDIPRGAWVVLTETLEAEYETAYRIGDTLSEGRTVQLETLTEPVEVLCINTREGVIETGITLDSLPYGLMVTAAGLGLWFPGKRRRHKE